MKSGVRDDDYVDFEKKGISAFEELTAEVEVKEREIRDEPAVGSEAIAAKASKATEAAKASANSAAQTDQVLLPCFLWPSFIRYLKIGIHIDCLEKLSWRWGGHALDLDKRLGGTGLMVRL